MPHNLAAQHGLLVMANDRLTAARVLLHHMLGLGIKIPTIVEQVDYYRRLQGAPSVRGAEDTLAVTRKFLGNTKNWDQDGGYHDGLVHAARSLIQTNRVNLPSFLNRAALLVGAHGSEADGPAWIFSIEQLVQRGATLHNKHFAQTVAPYHGSWLTYRLSSGATDGRTLNVGLLTIRANAADLSFHSETPVFTLHQLSDAEGKDSVSRIQGVLTGTGDRLALLGERQGAVAGVGYVGLVSWSNEEARPLVRATCCIPNSEGDITLATFMVLAFLADSDQWTVEEADAKRQALTTRDAKGGRVLGKHDLDEAPPPVAEAIRACLEAARTSLGVTNKRANRLAAG